jgi:predicted nucleotidyltransferase
VNQSASIPDLCRLVRVAFPETRLVVLFGSQARGESRTDSDFDLLVVTPTDLRPAARGARLRKVLREVDASFDLLVLTPDEFEKVRGFKSGVVARALAEGTTLHAA